MNNTFTTQPAGMTIEGYYNLLDNCKGRDVGAIHFLLDHFYRDDTRTLAKMFGVEEDRKVIATVIHSLL